MGKSKKYVRKHAGEIAISSNGSQFLVIGPAGIDSAFVIKHSGQKETIALSNKCIVNGEYEIDNPMYEKYKDNPKLS